MTRFSAGSVEVALASPDRQLCLAANLYQVTLGVQGLDLLLAQRAFAEASKYFVGEEDPQMQWWYHHLDGALLSKARRYRETRDALQRAIAATSRVDGLDIEFERSRANILSSYCRSGDAPGTARQLLKMVREQESAELGPVFYQVVAYVLHWLGEYEFAYSLRLHGMQSSNPIPARLARDHREFARTLISLDRLDEAEFHLRTAMEWNQHATAEETVRTICAAVEYAAAREDTDEVRRLLEEMRTYGADDQRYEGAIVTTARLLFSHGDVEASERLLESLGPDGTTPTSHPNVLSLRAEIAAHRGDHLATLELYRRAASAPELTRTPTETIVAICREITQWVSTTGPDSLVPPVVENRFFDGSRWLMATARDMRRSMAPSRLALESEVPVEVKLDVLDATIDDLDLLGMFLADSAGPSDDQMPSDFWALHRTAERIVDRVGATLQTDPEPGAPLGYSQTGLAGRLAFGLISIVADHATPGSTLMLCANDDGFVIDASAMSAGGRVRIQDVLAELCAPFRARNVILPSRASFVATYRAAISLGWSVVVDCGQDATMRISVDVGDGKSGSEGRYLFAASPAVNAEPEPEPDMSPPRPDSSDPELFAAIAHYHDHRFEALEFDFSLLDAARSSGDVELLASTLLVASSAELWSRRPDRASDLFDEARVLTEVHGIAMAEVWPGLVYTRNREYWLAMLKGDIASSWISATQHVLNSVPHDSSNLRMLTAMNWSVAEIDRGAFATAWLFSNMCDPTRTSEQGRMHELCIHGHVLLAEGRIDDAVPVAQECLSLARVGMARKACALELHVKTMAAAGRFGDAWASVHDHDKLFKTISPSTEALAAGVLWAEGRIEEAHAQAVVARERETPAFGAMSLSISVPIEAEGLLARDDPEGARRVLDSFPIEQHRYLDLAHRLDVDDRVAAALGDHDRQIDVARHLFSLRSGVPRWDARKHPVYYKFWRKMEAAVSNDRQRIEAEQAAVATVVTHDLRNALSGVTLAVNLASARPDVEILERAGHALEPIRSLAGQLDAVAQWDGSSRVAPEDLVDIVELLDSIEFPNKSVYELSGGVLEVNSDLPEGLVIPTKRNMLAIILRNLVGNAIKHGRRDGTVRVSATAHVEDDSGAESVVIAVDDDGPGLSAHQAARLQDRSRVLIEPGQGLGLWIVRRYAAALGLPVEVSTSELGGTRVAVQVKIPDGAVSRQAAVSRCKGATVARRSEPERPSGHVEVDTTRRRVMVVEDDATLSTLVVELLVRKNRHVATATTASEAIRLLERETFDVILTDIDLADGSTGYDVLASIYDECSTPEVVVMSGQAIEQTRIDLTRRFGTAMAVLQKPFTADDLYRAVGL